ncbi:probable methyltransferase-like protein 15 homolog [Haliotis asinina]|uniref:probable methyltransferase-like protein 15 homolog n=1 Tax=Haliotis asinina TaxID=109174 RepID=UPI003531C7E2
MEAMSQVKQFSRHKLSFCKLRLLQQVCSRKCHLMRPFYNASDTNERQVNQQRRQLDQQGQQMKESRSRMPNIPVMLKEVMDVLKPKDGQVIIDMTFGGGGHTREIISQAQNARVFTLDRDPVAFEMATQLSQDCKEGQITPLLGRFSDLHKLLRQHNVEDASVDSFLFDVGASSMQFDQAIRGFSLSQDGPLDMRMDGGRLPDQPTAADVVNHIDEHDLYVIIKKYGEEKLARKIASAIVDTRYAFGNITRTRQLADIVASVFQGHHRRDKMMRHSHVATKTFQALRIFVNDELNELSNGLELAHRFLKPGGVCVALSFHSLEDRIIKRHFHGIDMHMPLKVKYRERNPSVLHDRNEVVDLLKKRWLPLSKKVCVPTYADCIDNPRARSAKLRAAAKIQCDE